MSVFPDLEPGCVWLVGAGPGDPGLLSLLGLHALRQADFVIFDSTLEPELLGLIPVTAIGERVDRGHRSNDYNLCIVPQKQQLWKRMLAQVAGSGRNTK